MTKAGDTLLVPTGADSWRVEMPAAAKGTEGLGYRWSKRLDDKTNATSGFAEWGSLVSGTDTGDGWLELQIPMEIDANLVQETADRMVLNHGAAHLCSLAPEEKESYLVDLLSTSGRLK